MKTKKKIPTFLRKRKEDTRVRLTNYLIPESRSSRRLTANRSAARNRVARRDQGVWPPVKG